eukprot:CAMPEP_0185759072 /NCGR_PEP_ID=MMETSP1174-20130828/17781_1 /TAXON_ID=35687 /ORGANISM="Dictyocha speculum, Strain CCMP1381" /LENGTH=129 /DNA_ID=CAMNT_0028439233 /DNA_START=366 /DNA_END=755 /DNA_ORIENTATION=-
MPLILARDGMLPRVDTGVSLLDPQCFEVNKCHFVGECESRGITVPRLVEPSAVENEVRDDPPKPTASLVVVSRKRLPLVHLRAEGAVASSRACESPTVMRDANLSEKLREKVLQVVMHGSPQSSSRDVL